MNRYHALMNIRTGAESVTSPLRGLGLAAVETYTARPGHKRWFLWAVHQDGSAFVREGDSEADVADAFGYMSSKDTPYGDLSDIKYAAYWDTSKPTVTPSDEYGGSINVDGSPPVPPKPKSKGFGGLIVGGIITAVLGGIALASRKRGVR